MLFSVYRRVKALSRNWGKGLKGPQRHVIALRVVLGLGVGAAVITRLLTDNNAWLFVLGVLVVLYLLLIRPPDGRDDQKEAEELTA